MAAATVDSSSSSVSNDHHLNHLHAEALPLIDLRLLSQSELLSLSLCSSSFSSVHSLHNDTDVSTPRIDRSVFNESAGSRKQTFSRLRLAPRSNSQFISSSRSSTTPVHQQSSGLPLDEENSQIILRLKSLFGVDSRCDQNGGVDNLVSIPVQFNENLSSPSNKIDGLQNVHINVASFSGSGEIKQPSAVLAVDADSSSKKRKRGRPRKNETNVYSNRYKIDSRQVFDAENKTVLAPNAAMENNRPKEKMGIVNMSGKAVDMAALGTLEDPYGEELRRITGGMRTKAEVLGFLQGIQGEWMSSRKKRRIVDASAFGSLLPSGWKLMICVRRRAGHVWLDCRRYIRFSLFRISELVL